MARSRLVRRVLVLLLLALLAGATLAGCARPPGPDPTPTTTGPANACTPFAAPKVQGTESVRGQNAFDFMIGLVCDHGAGAPQERLRVPG
ncbi:MAG: hypothetical protein ACRDH5_07915, partial [bacterium]